MRIPVYAMLVLLIATACSQCAATDASWMKRVPDSDRKKENPYAGQPEAVAAGAKLFADHCAQCHGADALGHGKRPSLRTPEVQNAADGEIFWMLRNGYLRRGMPTWSSLPEQSRWQIITYIKSLGITAVNHSNDQVRAEKQ